MPQLFANNAASTLAAGITNSATSLSLVEGQGALFPIPTGGDWFMLTLTQGSLVEYSWEVVKVTARSDDVLTIVRAQEGTAAASWEAGSKAELRVTASSLLSAIGGATGPTGPAGPTGSAGPTGAAGVKGDTGTTGAAGAKGDTGTAGTAGTTGSAGAAGAQGIQGVTGTTGSTGAAGAQGIQGATGTTGSAGAAGAAGAAGSSAYALAVAGGFTGNQAAWIASLVGATGAAGAAGAAGSTGSAGAAGAAGTAGADGAAGVKGDKGDTGATGATGAAGSGGSGSGLTPTAVKTANYTAAANDLVRVDSTAGGFTITLPIGVDGALISILDVANQCAVHNVLVVGASSVEGESTGLNININGAFVPLIYIGATSNWKVAETPTVGLTGATGAVGATGATGNTGATGSTGTTGATGAGADVPKITGITYPSSETAVDVAGGETVTLVGTGFAAGASLLIGTSPFTTVSVVAVVSATSITFTAPAVAAGTYPVYLVNTDGATAIAVPGISYSGVPAWTTAAGTLGVSYETGAVSTTLAATGDAPVTYSVVSGSLPTNITLNSSTGLISGTNAVTASSTTYSFVIKAVDAQNQTTTRSFSITVNPDVVTWTSPADGTAYLLMQSTAMSAITLVAASAAGGTISYSADTLPAGVSISGDQITGAPTTISSGASVITAATATTNKTATRTFTWTVAAAADPYFNKTVLLLQGNGANNAQNNTLIDSSTNNFAVTRNGTPAQGTFSPFSQTGWSGYFNGTTDYLSLPSSSSQLYLTGAFTWETWIYPISSSGHIYGPWNNASSNPSGWEFAFNNSGLFGLSGRIYWYVGTHGFDEAAKLSTTAMPLNQWNHLAIVRDASNNVYIFLNGVSLTLATHGANGRTWSDSVSLTTTAPIGIGGTAAYKQFNGYLSNMRFVSGTAVYTSAFIPPTDPLTAIAGTSLLTLQNNCFKDNSSNNFAITATGTPSIQAFSPFAPAAAYSASAVGGGMYFNGSTDYFTLPDSTAFSFGSGNLTIEFWTYMTSSANTSATVISQWTGSSGRAWTIFADGSVSVNGWAHFAAPGGFALNKWQHYAWVVNGTDSRLYVNGVSVASTTAVSINDSSANIAIGFNLDGAPSTYYFPGYISNLRVVKGTAVYTTAFTPPTAPLTAIANTSLLLLGTNAGIIDATTKNLITTAGTAKISTTQSKFGGSSMYIDGNTGQMFVAPNQAFNFGTENFTIEFWVYRIVAILGRNQLLGNRPSVATSFNGAFWMDNYNNTSRTCFQSQGGAQYNIFGPSDYPAAGNWFHYAVVRNGTSLAAYINGASAGSATVSASDAFGSSTASICSGRFSDSYDWLFNGYIDDLRITKGYARYTANFTPPTSTFMTR